MKLKQVEWIEDMTERITMFEALKATIERIANKDYAPTSKGEALWYHDIQTMNNQVDDLEEVFNNNEEILDEVIIVIKELENKYKNRL